MKSTIRHNSRTGHSKPGIFSCLVWKIMYEEKEGVEDLEITLLFREILLEHYLFSKSRGSTRIRSKNIDISTRP